MGRLAEWHTVYARALVLDSTRHSAKRMFSLNLDKSELYLTSVESDT